MGRYSVTTNKAGINTANSTMFGVRAGTGQTALLVELAVSIEASPTAGPTWRLNRATAAGTASTQVVPQAEDPDNVAALTRLDSAWSVAPTAAAVDLRRYSTPTAVGSGIVWTFYDRPFRIAPTTNLLLINATAAGTTLGTFAIYAVFYE